MEFALSHQYRDHKQTITVLSEPGIADVEEAVSRLQTWAHSNGGEVTGRPFVRVHGRLSLAVHLPVASRVVPHPRTGIGVSSAASGPIMRVEGVPFAGLQGFTNLLVYELGAETRMAGPPEFHAGMEGWSEGTVILPVVKLPASEAGPLAVATAKLRSSVAT